jgi:hypothetical protein
MLLSNTQNMRDTKYALSAIGKKAPVTGGETEGE